MLITKRILACILCIIISFLSVGVFASSAPDYLQLPYFDDFQSYSAFSVKAGTGATGQDIPTASTIGALPAPYDKTTITQGGNGTISFFNDGVDRGVKSTHNGSGRLNLEIGDFAPGSFAKYFVLQFRFKIDAPSAGATPNTRLYGQLATGAAFTNGNANFNDQTLKLFFIESTNVRMMANSGDANSDAQPGNVVLNSDYALKADTWYTITCAYDFSAAGNNFTMSLKGDGQSFTRTSSYANQSKITNGNDLTRFRLTHHTAGSYNYSDFSFYTPPAGSSGSSGTEYIMTAPFNDDFEGYDYFNALAVEGSSTTDVSPAVMEGALPDEYKNSTLTPRNAAIVDRSYIRLDEDNGGNHFIRLNKKNSDDRINFDIGPFPRGYLTGNKVKGSFKMRVSSGRPGVGVMLSSSGAGDKRADVYPSVPLFYFWAERTAIIKGPLTNLDRPWSDDNMNGGKAEHIMSNVPSTNGRLLPNVDEWFDVEFEVDYTLQTLKLDVYDSRLPDWVKKSVTSLSRVGTNFNPKDMTVLRFRIDERSGYVDLDDIQLSIIPKFFVMSDMDGQQNIDPTAVPNIDVEFPSIKANPATITVNSVVSTPDIPGLDVTNIKPDGSGFIVDLSGASALQGNTDYTLTFIDIWDGHGNPLTNASIKFKTSALSEYVIYRDTFRLFMNGSPTTPLTQGNLNFQVDIGNFSSGAITFAAGMYKKGNDGYDTLMDYSEEEIPANWPLLKINKNLSVPSAGHYVKGYVLNGANSIAQDFIYDSAGLRFNDRIKQLYMPVNLDTNLIMASEALDDAENVCDGNLDTYWTSVAIGGHITVDAGESIDMSFVQLAFNNGGNAKYDVLVSDDGTTFSKVAAGVTINRENLTFIQNSFTPVKARYVRIQNTSAVGDDFRLAHVGLYRLEDNQFWAFR